MINDSLPAHHYEVLVWLSEDQKAPIFGRYNKKDGWEIYSEGGAHWDSVADIHCWCDFDVAKRAPAMLDALIEIRDQTYRHWESPKGIARDAIEGMK
jgi:hypothetical protein